jgi:hypothetical protein
LIVTVNLWNLYLFGEKPLTWLYLVQNKLDKKAFFSFSITERKRRLSLSGLPELTEQK